MLRCSTYIMMRSEIIFLALGLVRNECRSKKNSKNTKL